MDPIRPIRTDADHAAALREIERLFDAQPGTPEGDRLEVLATLVEAYEARHHKAEPADPVNVLKLVMRGQGRTQADLSTVLGSRSRASEVLNRRRALSHDMVERIAGAWAIPAEALSGPARIEGRLPRAAARGAAAALALALVVGAGIGGTVWRYGGDLPDVQQLAFHRTTDMARADDQGRVVERREFVPLAAIPRHVVMAFLASEDQDFFAHDGYSASAILRAMVRNLTAGGGTLAGGSTITQQLAKNLLLPGQPRSVERKVKELILAARIEGTLTKERILELYLNEIYFGGGAYGVQAAARQYFGKGVADLTVAQAAYLAALPKAPNHYRLDIAENRGRAQERRDWVLARMAEDGFITASAAHLARGEAVWSP